MNNNLYKLLESTKTIEQDLPKIIEAFVSYYGEENRTYIEEKFKNLLVIGYGNPEKLSTILFEIKQKKSEELIELFFNQLNIPADQRKELKSKLFSTYGLENTSLQPISCYQNYKEIKEKNSYESINYEYVKNRTFQFLKQFNPSVTLENMDELLNEGAFFEIDKLIPFYQNIVTLYNEEMKKLSEYIKEEDYIKKLKFQMQDQFFIQLLNEFSSIIPKEELVKINDNSFSGIISSHNFPITQSYFGSSLTGITLIESFGAESENLLITGRDWQKNSIKEDRIKFFKNNGIDLGYDYALYESNPNCKSIIPKQELIDKILLRKKELNEMFLNKYYKSTIEYKTNKEKIEEKNFLIKDNDYGPNAYFNNSTFVSPNLILEAGKHVLYPIMCININHVKEYLDVALIHELNHVFELNLKSSNSDSFEFICGWDKFRSLKNPDVEEIESLEEDPNKREYELFSEIINELIAQEITSNMHSNGIYIFNDETNAKIKGGTSYEHTLFLAKEFYDTYKEEILQSRKSGNIQVLFDRVGKENFEELNKLFHEFYFMFGGFAYYSLIDDLKSKKETKLTEKFFELQTRRDEILANMNEFSNSKSIN